MDLGQGLGVHRPSLILLQLPIHQQRPRRHRVLPVKPLFVVPIDFPFTVSLNISPLVSP